VRWRRVWIGALVLLLVLLLWTVSGAGFAVATAWLMRGDPPVPSDLLVVLGGGSEERVQTALDLYRARMAPTLLMTADGYPGAEINYFVSHGVPRSALMPPPRRSKSTYEDALCIKEVIAAHDFKSILVVTSPYHCRRSRLIIGRVLSGLGVRVTVTPSVSLYMDADHWWRSHQGWITVAWEYPKILWAWVTVPIVGPVEAPSP